MAFWFATIANTEISQLNEEAVPNSTKKAKKFAFIGSFYRQIFVLRVHVSTEGYFIKQSNPSYLSGLINKTQILHYFLNPHAQFPSVPLREHITVCFSFYEITIGSVIVSGQL